ncbi:MAG: AraC family transcriptional regulator, partial [Thermocrispum sp.]
MPQHPESPEIASGTLVVRASGAAAAGAAMAGRTTVSPASIQLLMRCTVPAAVADTGTALTFADCTLHVQPVERPAHGARGRTGAVMLTVAASKLSVTFTELRPLMFRPVAVEPPLRAVFSSAIANVLAAGETLDDHGLAHHLLGLAELV